MKYCIKCKRIAQASDEVCTKCGGPLSTFGAQTAPARTGAASPDPVGVTLGLQGELRTLQETQQRNVRRTRRLGLICASVLAALLATIYAIYARTVLSYAVISDVKIEQDRLAGHLIQVAFEVVSPGKVALDRRSGGRRTEKLDVFSKPGPVRLAWAWPSDPKTGVDFRVVYRTGLVRAEEEKHFAVSSSQAGVDVVFLIDITGSMGPFIEGLKRKCIEFAELVQREGYDCRLGLVAFGDVEFNEPIHAYEPTADFSAFQNQVGSLVLTGGGDLPESSVEALQAALELRTRPGVRVCFVHITDAPCHNPQNLAGVVSELRRRSITTYVVSQSDLQNLYGPLCVNGGRFHAIQHARFEEILLSVARSIANQIKTQ
jgi:Mg-chelatase subunit ChlD